MALLLVQKRLPTFRTGSFQTVTFSVVNVSFPSKVNTPPGFKQLLQVLVLEQQSAPLSYLLRSHFFITIKTGKETFGKRRDTVQGHADDQLSEKFAHCESIAHFSNVGSFIPSVRTLPLFSSQEGL